MIQWVHGDGREAHLFWVTLDTVIDLSFLITTQLPSSMVETRGATAMLAAALEAILLSHQPPKAPAHKSTPRSPHILAINLQGSHTKPVRGSKRLAQLESSLTQLRGAKKKRQLSQIPILI